MTLAQTIPSFVPAVQMADLLAPGAALQKLADGFKFVEGPVWTDADGGYLVFSDISGNRMLKWSAAGGIATFRTPSENANGNCRDQQGRLITCEHSSRRVTRTEIDGTVTVLVDCFEKKRFNSPNDVVVKRDGTIWFSDPIYGLGKNAKEIDGQYVYRIDADGRITCAIRGFDQPNGLCFSPDESKLYVADSGQPRHVRVFDVDAGNHVTGGEVFCAIAPGVPDGMRCDMDGRLWCTAGDGIHVYQPDGRQIGMIAVPEVPANCTFGGENNRTLFITARHGLYMIRLTVSGAVTPVAAR